MDWRVKGIVQKVLSRTPGGEWLNDRLQGTLGELRSLEANVATKVRDWISLDDLLRESGFSLRGAEILEVGTGWHPTLPLCFSLAGVGRCVTFDQTRHLSPALTWRVVASLRRHLPALAEATGRGLAELQEDWRSLGEARDLSELLAKARIDYRSPADAARTGLAAGSVDLVYSNSVLEHVPPDGILELLSEARRILRPGGIVAHCVACNDHYAHFDPSISFVNYLKFSDAEWTRWNNEICFQNRLRARDILDLVGKAGFQPVKVRTATRAGSLEALAGFTVAPEFARLSAAELAVTSVDFVARAAPRS
jgi:SAM-dependent methyltransferase